MPERKLDLNNPETIVRLADSLHSRPQNPKAYQAWIEAEKLEKGIKSREIKSLPKLGKKQFKIVYMGLTADGDDGETAELVNRALKILDGYVCKKHGVCLKDLYKARDWKMDQVDRITSRGGLDQREF